MTLPIVFCFAGQGSQYFQMARDLWTGNEVFGHWMRLGDALVAKRCGFSLLHEIYGEDRRIGQPFDRLEASHPAIFLVQFALAKALQQMRLSPDMLLGASLGEFTAHAVAGMTSFEAALLAVCEQPALFREHCPQGGMISVLASPEIVANAPALAKSCEIAGVNSANHFVLSASAGDLPAIQAELKALDAPFQLLPVPYAFHSRFIDAAQPAFCRSLASMRWETPFWPVWSSCTAARTGAASPSAFYWDVVRRPMDITKLFAAIEAEGGAVYVDLSPSGTLAAIFKQNLGGNSPSRIFPLLSPFGGNLERIGKAVRQLTG